MKIIVSDAHGLDGNRIYYSPDGSSFLEYELIDRIDNGDEVYFKPDGENSVLLIIVKNTVTNTRYLRTEANDKKSDNINNNIN